VDSSGSTYSSIPLEILSAAVFNSVFLSSDSKIKRTELRDLLKCKNDAEESEMFEALSPQRMQTPPARGFKPPIRKARGKKYEADDSDDENLPEEETCGSKIAKRIPFKLDDIEDGEDTGSTVQVVGGGPSRNTRSRATSNDKLV
jgi:hypothetical protein